MSLRVVWNIGGCRVRGWGVWGRGSWGGLAGWGWVLPPSPPRDCCRPHRTRQGDGVCSGCVVGGLDPCGAGGGWRLSGKGEEWSGRLTALRAPGLARSGRGRPDPCPSVWCHRWPRRHDVTGGVTKSPIQVRLGVGRVPAVAGTGGGKVVGKRVVDNPEWSPFYGTYTSARKWVEYTRE